MSPLYVILLCWAVAAVVMACLWRLAEQKQNGGIVDVAWAGLSGLFAATFAASADGNPVRRLLLGAMGLLWGARLAAHLFVRTRRLPEDGRYTRMRNNWGKQAAKNFFWFFQAQAFWSVLFVSPIQIAARFGAPVGPWDLLGLLTGLVSIAGERLADRQLAAFRSAPGNRGKVCQEGLWRYSRHPNYFFEWLHWWTYVLIGFQAPYGWLTLAGPALMLFFLLKVTGIPPTEEHALASRGDAYRQYQKTTSMFFPWPPKKVA